MAEWESAEAQAAAVEQATTEGVYAPVIEVIAGGIAEALTAVGAAFEAVAAAVEGVCTSD
jgi:hypothetical protein